METDKRGHVAVAVLLAMLILLAIAAAVIGTPAASAQPGEQDTGKITDADQNLLVKVREAGLSELPTAKQAEQHASSPRVKSVAAVLVTDHTKLDAQVLSVAKRAGVLLPNQPTKTQLAWMAELSGKFGSEYDHNFVNRLHTEHGAVLEVSAQVRVATRNSLIRSFAQHVTGIGMRHMTLLESTGLVRFDELPEAQPPPTTSSVVDSALAPATSLPPPSKKAVAQTVPPPAEGAGVPVGLVVVICIAEAGLTIGLLRLLRSH